MHNPYTTHGSPPEEDKTESGETPWKQASMGKLFDGEKISGPFVLGVLVLAAILFIGLMFASQHRQLRELRTRVDDIETHLEMQGVE